MSSGSQEKHAEFLEELARELRQFTALGASFFRAVAARISMTVTDMEVLNLLESAGPTTAGRLAELTGLTTGAITGMINRLEEAGLVCRERDPSDARRVIVRLVPNKDEMRKVSSTFASLGETWSEMASHYSDEQLAFLLEFLKDSNELARQEMIRLREAPADEEGTFSAPLEDLESARLVFPTGAFQLTLRAGELKGMLYQARFEGTVPDVKAKDGVLTIRYPRRLWLAKEKRAAEVTLNTVIPWQIAIQGGAAEITAELGGLKLTGLEVKGGLNKVRLELPAPAGVVPVRVSGGAADVFVQRPASVAARVHLKGWASEFVFDDQTFKALGNDVRLQSPGFDPTSPCYDIEVASSASMVTITAG